MDARSGGRVSGATVVYDTLRDRIMSQALAPGVRLNEIELAASLSVSRTPLREALRMLLSEGLVNQLPTGGMVVAPLDPQDMRELYVVRAALEGVVAREACPRLTEEHLAALDAIIDQMSRLLDYPGEMLRLGQQFHTLLLVASDNRRCEQLLRQLHSHLNRYQTITASIEPRRHEAYAEHQAILEALRARDADAAEARMRRHIMAAYTEARSAHPGES
ncbi:GntR family transcriptional regulator [Dactylosporangium roseum]|uniref:GntR family transcriptional regulator n=1 Tax=Dactylosporangium roseum TaxID=47989 RepID=A0ABY5YXA5_9ACTN|nr:GntR family transcriptional regulator [Dactylosporangium roseum]UWZ34374.1 GntR family transcriptional regulator [Dactylosporangium roseum]